MNQTGYTRPHIVLFLVLPYGISSGFAAVTLPFLMVKQGFTVAGAAAVTAWGLSANIWRFLWAPLVDLTLSLHAWYRIGVILCSTSLVLLCFIPIHPGTATLLTVIAFVSQVAATFVVAPVGGIMALTIPDNKKGRAGGWYQAGNLGGMGVGGGLGIWLAEHYSYKISGLSIALAMLACLFALYFVPLVKAVKEITIGSRLKNMFADLKQLLRSPIGIYSTVLIATPIGIGAASYIWSSVGNEWKASPDMVALVTGALSGVVSAIGCIAGGWVADKFGRWWSFFGSGTLMALVTLAMSFMPFTEVTYTVCVLVYSFTFGAATGAFSAVVLLAIGGGAASTKYAALSSFSNVAVVYMTALDGWMHDKYNTITMLLGETVLGLGFVALFLIVLKMLRHLPGFKN